nr:sigma-70 family RNA polymerase sigma factor [Dorea longicatena]
MISKNSDRRKRKVTFHKAKEEYKWKQWKEQEEKILKEYGVSEEVIQRIRELDWQDFNADRRFWEHFSSNQEELYTQKKEEESSVVLSIQQLLDSIENEQLLHILLETDRRTLQIVLLKMWGFSVREIAGQMGLPEKTIYTRIERLKKKIKKVLKK